MKVTLISTVDEILPLVLEPPRKSAEKAVEPDLDQSEL